MLPLTLRAMETMGHRVFTDGRYPGNLNIVFIRSPNPIADTFDDRLEVWEPQDSGGTQWKCYTWPVTTDPGQYYLDHPVHPDGTAILAPGQYRGSHRIGKHRGYTALVQSKPLRVVRDNDRDSELDWDGEIHTDVRGLNIHGPWRDGIATTVGRTSAGCLVFKRWPDFQEFMEICKKSLAAQVWGKSFSITLLNEVEVLRAIKQIEFGDAQAAPKVSVPPSPTLAPLLMEEEEEEEETETDEDEAAVDLGECDPEEDDKKDPRRKTSRRRAAKSTVKRPRRRVRKAKPSDD